MKIIFMFTESPSTSSSFRERRDSFVHSGVVSRVQGGGCLSTPSRTLNLNAVCRVLHQRILKANSDNSESPSQTSNSQIESLGSNYRTKFDLHHFLRGSWIVHVTSLFAFHPAIPGTMYEQSKKVIRDTTPPKLETVQKFLTKVFDKLFLSAECSIVAWIYVERLGRKDVPLTVRNWRPLILAALLAASKVWDDHCLWNVEFADLFSGFSLKDINLLERRFLCAIGYELYISSSEYALYYFQLRNVRLTSMSLPAKVMSHIPIRREAMRVRNVNVPKYYVPLNKPIQLEREEKRSYNRQEDVVISSI